MRLRVCGPDQAAVAQACSARTLNRPGSGGGAGHRRGDPVGEGERLVVGAARSAVGAGRPLLLGGGPVGGQDVRQLWAQPAGVRQLPGAQDLLGQLDEGVGPTLPGRAVVAGHVASGQGLQGGQERLAVLAAEAAAGDEPSASRRCSR